MIIYSTPAFIIGDSAEEFCLPLIAYTLYVGLKSITTRTPITGSQAFLIGLTAAAVLWIKYTMVGFYIGWIIVLIYIYIKNKWQSKIVSTIGFAIAGLIALTLPIFAYFSYHNALGTMLNVYFFDNAKYYSGYTDLLNLLYCIKNNIVGSYQNNFYLWILIISGIAFAGLKKVSTYMFLPLITLVIFIFIRLAMLYYSFILAVFAPLGIILLMNLFRNTKAFFSYSIASLITLNIIYNTISGTYIFKSTEVLAQHQFDKIIQSEANPTLLNYGFLDGGFYTYSGIIPSNRFFCRLNIPIPEMMQEQDSIIANQGVQFIVTRAIPDLSKFNTNNEFIGYKKVAVIRQPLENGLDAIYTLHKRIANTEVSK